MPKNTADCPEKPTIDKEANAAKGHIYSVLANPALASDLKAELDLAQVNLDNILKDNHHVA
jgi:hypothetical protein